MHVTEALLWNGLHVILGLSRGVGGPLWLRKTIGCVLTPVDYLSHLAGVLIDFGLKRLVNLKNLL